MIVMITKSGPRLSFVILNSPVVAVAEMAIEWRPLGGLMRSRVLKDGWAFPQLRHTMAPRSPLSHCRVLPLEELTVIAGAATASPRRVSFTRCTSTGAASTWPGSPATTCACVSTFGS